MQSFEARPAWSRRASALVALVLLGAVALAASASGAAARTSAKAASASLKTGLKVFVVPKNLGNNYFTVADSVKSGGALAALKTLGETGKETSGSAATPASQLPAPGRDLERRQCADRLGHGSHGAVPDAEAGDGTRDHGCDL